MVDKLDGMADDFMADKFDPGLVASDYRLFVAMFGDGGRMTGARESFRHLQRDVVRVGTGTVRALRDVRDAGMSEGRR